MKHNSVLQIKNLSVNFETKEILSGISLTVKSGEVHAVMGPNGSGKSTLAYALMGHPLYTVMKGSSVTLGQKELTDKSTEQRAKSGIFLAFQTPTAIPGVSVLNLLRSAYQKIYGSDLPEKSLHIQNPLLARRFRVNGLSLSDFMNMLKSHAKTLGIHEDFLTRGIHDGFSGGEKKKIEMLQALILSPRFAVFDEIDTGLDVDALKTVAHGIDMLKSGGTGILIITHYQRILKYIRADRVHILVKGKIVHSGSAQLAKTVEEKGYSEYLIS
jgi:Fe-S cluster assembly ATP-binding protein